MRNPFSSMVQRASMLLLFATLSVSLTSCLEEETSITQATEVNYTGKITVSLRSPNNVDKNDFWMVMSAPEEAELAAVCFIDKLEQCKKEENDKVDPTTGKKIKRFFPMDKKGVRGGRAFFKSQVSGYLMDGLILTFVYWVKDPSGTGYKTKDVRYVMYSKADGGTTTTVSGTSSTAGTSTATSGTASINLDELVRSKCSGGGCHEAGSSLRPYNNLAEAKAGTSVASKVSDGSMPKGRSLSSDEKAALLNALK